MTPTEPNPTAEATSTPKSSAGKWIRRSIHLVVLAVTFFFVGRHAVDAYRQLRDHKEPIHLHYDWLAVSIVSYTVGLFIFGIPFQTVLRDQGAQIRWPRGVGVYALSHVGKYAPGKAVAIILRIGLLKLIGLGAGLVTLATFYETFATMASGSLMGVLAQTALPSPMEFRTFIASKPLILPASLFCLAGFIGAVLPIGFWTFTHIVTKPFKSAGPEPVFRMVKHRTALISIVVGMIGWLAFGLSYLAAINTVASQSRPLGDVFMTTGCYAMANVLGFLSFVPGQIGVRELILIEALEDLVGGPTATLASLLHRLLTVLIELAVAACIYPGVRR